MNEPNIEINSNDMYECRDCFEDLGSSRTEALKHVCKPRNAHVFREPIKMSDAQITNIITHLTVALLAFAMGFSIALGMAEKQLRDYRKLFKDCQPNGELHDETSRSESSDELPSRKLLRADGGRSRQRSPVQTRSQGFRSAEAQTRTLALRVGAQGRNEKEKVD